MALGRQTIGDIKLRVHVDAKTGKRELQVFSGDVQQGGIALDKMDSKAKKLNKDMDTTSKKMKMVGRAIKIFLTGVVAKGILDMGKLAAEAANVRTAFDKVVPPGFLDTMRSATKGTISDLELMRASLIGLDLGATSKQLETFAKFARLEAVRKGSDQLQTLRDILSGVLRGSTELLDNFGFSLSAVNTKIEELAKRSGKSASALSAVDRRALLVTASVEMMNERLAKAGEIATTDLEKMQTLSAQWANSRESLGKFVNKFLMPAIIAVSNFLKETAEGWDEAVIGIRFGLEWLSALFKKWVTKLGTMLMAFGGVFKDIFEGLGGIFKGFLHRNWEEMKDGGRKIGGAFGNNLGESLSTELADIDKFFDKWIAGIKKAGADAIDDLGKKKTGKKKATGGAGGIGGIGRSEFETGVSPEMLKFLDAELDARKAKWQGFQEWLADQREKRRKDEERAAQEWADTQMHQLSPLLNAYDAFLNTMVDMEASAADRILAVRQALFSSVMGLIQEETRVFLRNMLIQKGSAEAAGAARETSVIGATAKIIASLGKETLAHLKSAGAAILEAIANIFKRLAEFLGPLAIPAGIGAGAALIAAFAGFKGQLGFDRGGYTGAGARYQPAGVVHRGEVVFEKPIVERNLAGLMQLRAAMQRGATLGDILPGFASGGYVGNLPSGIGGGSSRQTAELIRQNRMILLKLDKIARSERTIEIHSALEGQEFYQRTWLPNHKRFERRKV